MVWCLENSVQPYAWGSRTAIAALQGRPHPTAEPEAELWMGAHARAPSRLRDADHPTLLEAVRAEPEAMLGATVHRRFGPRLPFLLKVLAAAQPLSLQAHPNPEQARRGFDDEEARGIDRGAPHRNYRDPHAKPELVCALEPFVALCGFRPLPQTRELVDTLAVAALREATDALWTEPAEAAVASTLQRLMTLPQPGPVVDAVVEAGRAIATGTGPLADACAWSSRLAARYPGDAGVLVALLLTVVQLRPGEALFLGPGIPHSYLEGTAIEIMGSSDNVLRGGLTQKHVDVPELLRVLDRRVEPVPVLRARSISEIERVYDVPTPAFSLSTLELPTGGQTELSVAGPEIVLCTRGETTIATAERTLPLRSGASVFVPGRSDRIILASEGGATLYRATVGTGPDQASPNVP